MESSEYRALHYRLFAHLFAGPPGDEFLGKLKEWPLGAEAYLPYSQNLAEGIGAMREHLHREGTAEEVREEFNRLFYDLGGGQINPYASHYTEGLLFGKTLARLRSLLRVAGLQRNEDFHEPEDHLAFLMETAAMLIDYGKEHEERECIREYVFPWVGSLCNDIEAHSEANFYRKAAQALRGFMEWEERKQKVSDEAEPSEEE